MKTRTLIALSLLLPGLAAAQYNRPGSTDAQFLKIGVSARGAGMADAYLAVTNGAEATYYNAAALPWIERTDVVVNHTEWFAGIKHEFAAIARTFDDIGSFGLSVTALYTDEMKVRTPLQPEGTGETFYVGNYRFGLSYARFLTDRVTFGATISYVNMKLYSDFSADAVSLDIAVMYVSDFRGFRFALEIANFGSNIQYVNESYPLPTNFQFGVGMNAIESEVSNVLVSFTAIKPNEGEPLAQVGGEASFRDFAFLRGGYRFNYSAATYSVGAGVALDVSGFGVRVDYAYNDYQTLGGSHRIGIGFAF
jgi:hypothetical protein